MILVELLLFLILLEIVVIGRRSHSSVIAVLLVQYRLKLDLISSRLTLLSFSGSDISDALLLKPIG